MDEFRCEWSWLLKRECGHCLGIPMRWDENFATDD